MPSEAADQYRQFFEQLQLDDQRPQALNDIKNLLTNNNVNPIRDMGLSKIFHCLDAQDQKQVDLTCDVLKLCFDKFTPGEVMKNYTSYMMHLLRHEKDCVRHLAVNEVYKGLNNDSILPVVQFVDIFVAVSQLVLDRDTAISNKAILITSHLPFEAYPKVLDEMKIALQYNTSSKCNAFEVIINISSQSPELLKLSIEHGYIDYMLCELETNDILYHVNILELLSRLAVTTHGIKHLVECGALNKISALISDAQNNPLANLLIPGYVKFFGCIAHLYPRDIFEKYPILLNALFECFDGRDETVLPVALDTLGFIASTIEGKLSLAALGSKYTTTVSKVGELIRTGNTETKVRALHCFTSLISYTGDSTVLPSGPIDHRVILMTREWFRSLSTRPESMEVLHELCKNPFPDIRSGAFNLLNAVSLYHWGEELVAKTPGFVEYLLDRSVDHTKESKEAKYEVIKKLSRSSAFDSNTIVRLNRYVEEGPFYSEMVMQVAMEEGD